MNFERVRQANGENIVMNAAAARIDGVTYTQAGKPKQSCKFTDVTGEQQSVSIYQGTGQPIPTEKQGQTLSINISAKQGQRGGQLYYGGFWNSTAQVRQPVPQSTPQTPPQPRQATNADKPDWDAIAEGKVRHGLVCAYIQGGKEPTIEQLERWKTYIMTGQDANEVIPDPLDNVPAEDRDIPWEQG